jgi:hypothetical protein
VTLKEISKPYTLLYCSLKLVYLSGKASCSARLAAATSIFFLRISLKETGNRKDPRYIRICGINDSVISGEHCKSKAVPATRHGGTWGERRYSSYSYLTSALDGGVSGQRHAPAALYPRGKDPRYPLDRTLGGPQSRSGRSG